jgi:hypothetical protein
LGARPVLVFCGEDDQNLPAKKRAVPMVTTRPYRESDAESVGRLTKSRHSGIADNTSRFNLSFARHEELGKLLGPFRHP